VDTKAFGRWQPHAIEGEREDGDLYYRCHIESGHASYLRGIHIGRSRMSRDDAARNVGYFVGELLNKLGLAALQKVTHARLVRRCGALHP
jgi:hypothetical protein